MNKILVTGGAGFIGSNLCEHLLAHNYGSGMFRQFCHPVSQRMCSRF